MRGRRTLLCLAGLCEPDQQAAQGRDVWRGRDDSDCQTFWKWVNEPSKKVVDTDGTDSTVWIVLVMFCAMQ